MSKKYKIIIDVNIWVSYLIGKSVKEKMDKILTDKRFLIISSENLINELAEVIERPKIKKYLKTGTSFQIIQLLNLATQCILSKSIVTISTDVDDNYLLALCADSHADFLITGDKPHLLALEKFNTTQIVTLTEFSLNFDI